MTRLPAIIFDCDGVLVDSEWLASRVEAELLRDLGIELSVEQAHELFLGKTVAGVLDTISVLSGAPPSPAFNYNWAFATAQAFMRELEPVPHVRTALEELQARGHAMAVASQSPLARVRFSLEVTGLAGFFGTHVYVTTMVANPKPAPDVYLLAASRLGAATADCLVVEDSPAAAASARRVGMRAIGYAPGGTADAMRANGIPVVRSMDELARLVGG